MKRIIWHWTAGAEKLIEVEADSYHEIIQPDGKVQPGTWPVEANKSPIIPGRYAAHTLNANSDAIGMACDAMAGANEVPFKWGSNPLTEAQIEAMLQRTAYWCNFYKIEPGLKTTLSHAEVEKNLGIRQKNKWDFKILPGMSKVQDATVVGDILRSRLVKILLSSQAQHVTPPKRTQDMEVVEPTASVRVTMSGGSLRLRRWPSFNRNIIGLIPNGLVVPVQRRGTFDGRDWVCVNYNGNQGWVVASFVKQI